MHYAALQGYRKSPLMWMNGLSPTNMTPSVTPPPVPLHPSPKAATEGRKLSPRFTMWASRRDARSSFSSMDPPNCAPHPAQRSTRIPSRKKSPGALAQSQTTGNTAPWPWRLSAARWTTPPNSPGKQTKVQVALQSSASFRFIPPNTVRAETQFKTSDLRHGKGTCNAKKEFWRENRYPSCQEHT